MAQSGKVVLLYADIGAGVMEPVAQQQGLDITRGRNSQTVGHKQSSTDVVIFGNKTQTMALNGLMVRNDAGLQAIERIYNSGATITVRMFENGVAIREWLMRVQDFNESHPHDGVSTYTATLAPADEEIAI